MLTSTSNSSATTLSVHWTRTAKESALSEMFALLTSPDLLSFAFGLPAQELLPLEACRAAAIQALAADPQALQYRVRHESLKRHIQGLLAYRGVGCREEQIFLTTGAQQGIYLLVNLLLAQGQQVLLEEVTYEGLHMAIGPLQPEALIIPTEAGSGMDIDAVETQLAQGVRPAFIYVITDGHNPLGINLTMAARTRLVELARRFRVPIIEDDVFGFLEYEGPRLPPMRSLDEEWVFYIGSFSKILAPALRVGWIIAPDRFKPALSSLKLASDLDLTSFAQLTVSAYLDKGGMPDHLTNLRREYGVRRDIMLGALESHFPSEARWSKPGNGMFIWVELSPEIETIELLRMAVETERVAFMPGAFFATPNRNCARNGIRLNFTNCPPDRIEEGIMRLARVLKKTIKRGK